MPLLTKINDKNPAAEVSPDLVQHGRDKLEECQRQLEALEAGRAEAALLEAMKGSDMSQLELAIDRASSAGVSPEARIPAK